MATEIPRTLNLSPPPEHFCSGGFLFHRQKTGRATVTAMNADEFILDSHWRRK
jgi:hypothetical protein